MSKKVLKSEYGVELQEEGNRLFISLDGFQAFPTGIDKRYVKMVEKSYNNLIEIRKKDGYKK
jgi:hypothetical protein